jgi:hypothetical protein
MSHSNSGSLPLRMLAWLRSVGFLTQRAPSDEREARLMSRGPSASPVAAKPLSIASRTPTLGRFAGAIRVARLIEVVPLERGMKV